MASSFIRLGLRCSFLFQRDRNQIGLDLSLAVLYRGPSRTVLIITPSALTSLLPIIMQVRSSLLLPLAFLLLLLCRCSLCGAGAATKTKSALWCTQTRARTFSNAPLSNAPSSVFVPVRTCVPNALSLFRILPTLSSSSNSHSHIPRFSSRL
jgi:hypothetical protein